MPYFCVLVDGLYVSAVHHRAVIEVNEHGTEAAAVTIGTGDRTIDELPVPFNVNKPFIFFIYHVKAETVLFWGRVTRPE
jgi:serine protease inhibitor